MDKGRGRVAGGASQATQEPRAGECPAQEPRRRSRMRQCHLEGGRFGTLLSPTRRRETVRYVQARLSVSERRACRVMGQCRATQQYVPRRAGDEEALRTRSIALSREYGRYG
jgi:hypothetical protein